MSSPIRKTVIATGVSSGLGFEAMKQLLAQKAQPYHILLGARNTISTQTAYDILKHNTVEHSVSILPLDLNNLKDVKKFANQTLEKLGSEPIDFLLLNAALGFAESHDWKLSPNWREAYVVNGLSQHYLVHLLKDKLIASCSRIVFVSSGAIRRVQDPSVLDKDLKAASPEKNMQNIYSETKFAQLLNAHWWRRHLAGRCTVVAVSPGLIPGTGLARGSSFKLTMDMPDAKSVAEGGANVLRAFYRDDIPEDLDQIFLTSWGEWWPKDVYKQSLDHELQEKWSLGKEEIENMEGLVN